MKFCKKCNIIKSKNEFQINNSTYDGLHRICKICYSEHRKNVRNSNKSHYKQYAINRYIKYKNDWLKFFQTHYTIKPHCSICNTSLRWQSNIGKFEDDLVCWDHFSIGSCDLLISPSAWLGAHVCNKTNQQKWLSFHLGILCTRCNGHLPTKNRIEWLEKALSYSKQHLEIEIK